MWLHKFESCRTYEDLEAIRDTSSDRVLATLDLENIDHPCDATTPIEKLSEVRVAAIDLRKLNKPIADATFEELVTIIQARHIIVQKWAWVTPKTCPSTNKWHKNRGKPHVANPYTCQFAHSRLMDSGKKAMEHAVNLMADLTNWEIDKNSNDPKRDVDIMCWAAGLEQATIDELNPAGFPASSTHFKDLQKFSPVKERWYELTDGRKTQPNCGDFLYSLGLGDLIGGGSVYLPNACNDAFMELVAYLRMLKFTDTEWDSWMNGNNLPATPIKVQNENAYQANSALENKMTARRRRYY